MMTDQEYKIFMFEEFKKAYGMGMADFYKLLMQLPEENLDANAKQTITFCLRSYLNSSQREIEKYLGEIREGKDA